MLTVKVQYLIDFSRLNRKFCLSLHYNGRNSFLFVNATGIYQFKAKDSEVKKHPLCLACISGDYSVNDMEKKRTKWVCAIFLLIIVLLILVRLLISKSI